ncbi:MAG: YlmH/Sll1252 family protein [Eubacteriales bacterium]|nr:YlmH/Sll1252 family protein [Eubacteriales bacterium]
MEKDDFLLKRIRELANLSYQRDIVTFSDFLNLNQQNMLHSLKLRDLGVVMETFGGYENAERQMAAFHPDALMFPWEYPIDCLRIQPKALKFSQELTHRDYLGAILNLGVDRSVVGDILVQEKEAWMFCQRRMTDFFLENLCRVKHTTVLVTRSQETGELPSPRFQEITATCSSVRLDALIAAAFQASRSSMVSYIENGLVFVNGRLVTSNGYEPKEGDIISVRGQGRFLFDGVLRQTKKGRSSIRLRRYV